LLQKEKRKNNSGGENKAGTHKEWCKGSKAKKKGNGLILIVGRTLNTKGGREINSNDRGQRNPGRKAIHAGNREKREGLYHHGRKINRTTHQEP